MGWGLGWVGLGWVGLGYMEDLVDVMYRALHLALVSASLSRLSGDGC